MTYRDIRGDDSLGIEPANLAHDQSGTGDDLVIGLRDAGNEAEDKEGGEWRDMPEQ